MKHNKTDQAIERIKTISAQDKALSGAIILMNLIPYAGGAIASLITDYASQQNVKKLCDVLSDLNGRLESHTAEPEKHLSDDQVVELVHQTLAHVRVTSDDVKIQALKNGLAYSFIKADRFEAKQIFLDTLRSCGSLELVMMDIIYKSSDPYIIHEREQTDEPAITFSSSQIYPNEQWVATENRSCNQPQLIEYLASRVSFEPSLLRGVAHMLDGRGLTNMVPNLAASQCKVMQRADIRAFLPSSNLSTYDKPIQPTPLEASQTQFGRNFLDFCNYS